MKKYSFALIILLFSFSVPAQIPNAGFETWFNAGSYEDAQGWASYNPYTQFASVTTVSKTTDSYSGTYAALVETKSFFNTITGMQDTTIGFMITAPDAFSSDPGLPYALRPDSLKAYYKYAPAGGDVAAIGIALSKWNSAAGVRDVIATGEIAINVSAANYTAGSAPLSYFLPDFPDTALIYIFSSNGSIAVPGSALTVDDISLEITVGINEAETSAIAVSAFPNPAKENIRFKISTSTAATIIVYDLTGREISTFRTEGKDFVDADVRHYEAGLYFCVVKEKHGSKKATGKFCVTK